MVCADVATLVGWNRLLMKFLDLKGLIVLQFWLKML